MQHGQKKKRSKGVFADKARDTPGGNEIPWNCTETWSRRDWIKLRPANWLPSWRHFDDQENVIKLMISFLALSWIGNVKWEWASYFVGGTAVEHSGSLKRPLLLVSTRKDVSSSLIWGPQENYHLPAVASACPTTATSLQVRCGSPGWRTGTHASGGTFVTSIAKYWLQKANQLRKSHSPTEDSVRNPGRHRI